MRFIITFGSHANYIEAGRRLLKQSMQLDLFDGYILYTPDQLKEEFQKHAEFIRSNPRGYGYWIWKPYVIQKTMQMLKDGDVLLYMDCGCELDAAKRHRLHATMKLVETELLMGTCTGHDDQTYTKRDLVECIQPPLDCLSTVQHQAGVLLWYVCPKTRQLVDEWYTLCCDYRNIDDSPSLSPNVANFVEHRHDQSVFSLLTKKHALFSKHAVDGVEYIRNRSGHSVVDRPQNHPKARIIRMPMGMAHV
jgi:hypothetical protein